MYLPSCPTQKVQLYPPSWSSDPQLHISSHRRQHSPQTANRQSTTGSTSFRISQHRVMKPLTYTTVFRLTPEPRHHAFSCGGGRWCGHRHHKRCYQPHRDHASRLGDDMMHHATAICHCNARRYSKGNGLPHKKATHTRRRQKIRSSCTT